MVRPNRRSVLGPSTDVTTGSAGGGVARAVGLFCSARTNGLPRRPITDTRFNSKARPRLGIISRIVISSSGQKAQRRMQASR
jgi:hypothetical protein